jgi:hypothetical protein
MSEILKGNFSVKNPPKEPTEKNVNSEQNISELLKEKVMTSLGGSMVYMERSKLSWDEDNGK